MLMVAVAWGDLAHARHITGRKVKYIPVTLENAKAFIGAKMASNPKLSEARESGSAAKLERIAMEEMPPLES